MNTQISMLPAPQFAPFIGMGSYDWDSRGITPASILRAGFCSECQAPLFYGSRRSVSTCSYDGKCPNCHFAELSDSALWLLLQKKLTVGKLATVEALENVVGTAWKRLGTRKEISARITTERTRRADIRSARFSARVPTAPVMGHRSGWYQAMANAKKGMRQIAATGDSHSWSVETGTYRLAFVVETSADWHFYAKSYRFPKVTTEFRGLVLSILVTDRDGVRWTILDREPCASKRDCHHKQAYAALKARNEVIP